MATRLKVSGCCSAGTRLWSLPLWCDLYATWPQHCTPDGCDVTVSVLEWIGVSWSDWTGHIRSGLVWAVGVFLGAGQAGPYHWQGNTTCRIHTTMQSWKIQGNLHDILWILPGIGWVAAPCNVNHLMLCQKVLCRNAPIASMDNDEKSRQ